MVEMMIEVVTIIVGIVSTNCYLVYNVDNKEAVIIDPGDKAEEIIKRVDELNLSVRAILITHGHFDHIGAADALRNNYSVKVYSGEHEKDVISNIDLNGSKFFKLNYEVEADILLKDNEELNICGIRFTILYTPGHTKGGICYYIPDEKMLFCGDTLFYESIGRTDRPTGDKEVLYKSIRNLYNNLPDDIILYPGHGQKTTIGHEKINNPYVNI